MRFRHIPSIALMGLCSAALCNPAPSQVLDPAWTQRAQQLANDAARMAFGDQIPVRVEVVPGQLDPRLSLAPCQKVDVFIPAGQRAWGRTRIGLKCLQGPVPWNVTLPLTVRLWAPALVAAGPLPAGTMLTGSHLRMSEVDWAERDSPVLFLETAALGRTLATALSPGAPVRQEHLRKRQWFDAGDTVRLHAVGPGFIILAEGVAITPGIEGQNARIRTESGRTITGTPVGQRLAEVQL
ncbi:MAG: flagellar basal body P-ring formation chaperone FlgA [Rubrivivax sp.]